MSATVLIVDDHEPFRAAARLLAGMLRARLARASVGDLVVELERTPPHGLRRLAESEQAKPALFERSEFLGDKHGRGPSCASLTWR